MTSPALLVLRSEATQGWQRRRAQVQKKMSGTADNEQEDVIAFLSNPHTYGDGVATVEHYETHASVVFLAGHRA